jgi:single-stranded DNA-binding protein
MASVNLCLLSGVVTSDVSTNGDGLCSFNFENTETKKGYLNKAIVTVITYGDIASMCALHVKNGAKLYIEGRLKTNSSVLGLGEKYLLDRDRSN